MKVQARKIKANGKEYAQFWIPLPKKLCDALEIAKGSDLKVLIKGGDLILKKI